MIDRFSKNRSGIKFHDPMGVVNRLLYLKAYIYISTLVYSRYNNKKKFTNEKTYNSKKIRKHKNTKVNEFA